MDCLCAKTMLRGYRKKGKKEDGKEHANQKIATYRWLSEKTMLTGYRKKRERKEERKQHANKKIATYRWVSEKTMLTGEKKTTPDKDINFLPCSTYLKFGKVVF